MLALSTLTARFPTDEASSTATVVATRSARYRTGAGIGVGSTRAALRRAHPAVACGGEVCRLRRPAGLTRFHMAGSRVVRVSVSFGAPIHVAGRYDGVPLGRARREVTDQIMAAIQELSGQEPAGVYNERAPEGS